MTEPTLPLHRIKALREKRKRAKLHTFGNQVKRKHRTGLLPVAFQRLVMASWWRNPL